MKYEVHREKSPAFVPVTVTLELDTPEKLNAFTALAVFSLRAGTAVDVALNDRYNPAPGANRNTIDDLFPCAMVNDLTAQGGRWHTPR
jgi:hypothetical protein